MQRARPSRDVSAPGRKESELASLDGKVAIITGASRGIGAATARRLAADGARITVNYASAADLAAQVVEEVNAAGGEGLAVRADLGSPDEVRTLVDQTVNRWGRIDILVNNAGDMSRSRIEEITPEAFDRFMHVNVLGPILLVQNSLPHFPAEGGRIINISSGLAHNVTPAWTLYAASKLALEAATMVQAVELGPRGITANAVAVGVTDTGHPQPPGFTDAVVRQTALGRVGQPDDIADVIAFLASEQSRWVTGEVLFAHGGIVTGVIPPRPPGPPNSR
jgi:NAD(P)-dependent dehydrogenase (short-subunit alcohol dehydrogenase family)